VWETEVDGQPLKFHLAGINNQNFIMRDETTGSWWQQVSGAALHGPLKGKQLKEVFVDEISFAVWKREHPNGRVLRPDAKYQAQYAPANWEAGVGKMRVVTPADPQDKLPPRELISGLTVNGKSKAYAQADLIKQRLTLDEVGGVPLFLIVGEDQQSVRAFERKAAGRVLEFFVKADATPLQMIDAETNTVWDFSGKAVSGPLAGQQLAKIALLKDYWFDWKLYHPDTAVYSLGARLNSP
jgi:hypothetical protein